MFSKRNVFLQRNGGIGMMVCNVMRSRQERPRGRGSCCWSGTCAHTAKGAGALNFYQQNCTPKCPSAHASLKFCALPGGRRPTKQQQRDARM